MQGGDRQRENKSRAFARRRFNFHAAAQLLDLEANHIHAHPAAREVGDGFGGGKTGQGDELVGFRVIQDFRPLGADESFAHRGVTQLVRVHAASVIAQGDHRAVGAPLDAQGNHAQRGFSRGAALRGVFKAVIQAVAQQVHERIHQLVQHPAIEDGIHAAEAEFRLLADFHQDILKGDLETVGDHREGHQTDIGDLAREFEQHLAVAGEQIRGLGLAAQSRVERGVQAEEPFDGARHVIEAAAVHAHGRGGHGGRNRRGDSDRHGADFHPGNLRQPGQRGLHGFSIGFDLQFQFARKAAGGNFRGVGIHRAQRRDGAQPLEHGQCARGGQRGERINVHRDDEGIRGEADGAGRRGGRVCQGRTRGRRCGVRSVHGGIVFDGAQRLQQIIRREARRIFRRQLVAQQTHGAHPGRAQGRARRGFAVAHAHEAVFKRMTERLDGVKAHRSRHPFQRVRGAERGLQRGHVRGRAGGDEGLQGRQVFGGLLPE